MLATVAGRILFQVGREVLRKNPDILDRLQQHAGATLVVAPNDRPVVFQLRPLAGEPIAVLPQADMRDWDARVTAPLLSLLAMAHGKKDGDALFFSREVVIEGDTSVVLALRNALDAAEIDLVEEFCRLLGPLDRPAGRLARWLLAMAERRSGPDQPLPMVRP